MILSWKIVFDTIPLQLPPQQSLHQMRIGLQIEAVLGAYLLCHQHQIGLKWHREAVKYFDRHLFQTPRAIPAIQLAFSDVFEKAKEGRALFEMQ